MNQKRRILHLLHQFLPEKVGGTELYTQKLAQTQASAGHEVTIFYPSSQPGGVDERVAGVRVVGTAVGERSAGQVFAATLRSNTAVVAAWQTLLQETQPDIIHIQHLMGLPLDLLQACCQQQIPYVVTLHDYWYGCANAQLFTNYDQTICPGPDRLFFNCGRCAGARAGGTAGQLLTPFLSPLMAYRHKRLRPILRDAAAVIAPTQFVYNIYGAMGFAQANFVVLPHGLEPPASLPAPPAQPDSDFALEVVYVGGIAPQKGVHILLEACVGLPEVKLTMYGDTAVFPDYTTRLRDLIPRTAQNRIQLAGRIPHEQVWRVLAEASVVAIPTLWYETSSLILDEAFVVGTPPIASDIGVLASKIRAGTDGVLVPPGNVSAWRRALRELAQSPAQRQKLAQNAPPVLSVTEHTARLLALYEQAR